MSVSNKSYFVFKEAISDGKNKPCVWKSFSLMNYGAGKL